MEVIRIENLSFAYHSHNVIKNINLRVEKGEFVCIVGENGGGKSTLIKCILGLNKGYKGKIVSTERIGYLPQVTEVQNNFPATIEEVVLSGTIPNGLGRLFYNKEDKQMCNDAIEQVGLQNIRKKCFRELSGGQKQRTLIARAICSAAKILILDEPVNGLDPDIAAQVYSVVRKINKEDGITVIMVSHDVHRALDYADRVVQIKAGEISFNGSPKEYDCRENK